MSFLSVSSVMVIAELFATAMDDPPLLPRAPRESVLKLVMFERVFKRSTLETEVAVKDSFSRVVLFMRANGRRIPVKDTSSRRRSGQISSIVFTTWSLTGVSFSLRACKPGSFSVSELPSSCTPNAFHNLVMFASVYDM